MKVKNLDNKTLLNKYAFYHFIKEDMFFNCLIGAVFCSFAFGGMYYIFSHLFNKGEPFFLIISIIAATIAICCIPTFMIWRKKRKKLQFLYLEQHNFTCRDQLEEHLEEIETAIDNQKELVKIEDEKKQFNRPDIQQDVYDKYELLKREQDLITDFLYGG